VRLSRIILNCRSPATTAAFFVRALGFTLEPAATEGRVGLALGESRLELAAVQGRPYPGDVPGWSPVFQHFAIVTRDMDESLARLRFAPDWRAISTGGPQRLPAASGGATAFKFRDPEGHPLELIAFAGDDPGPIPRIDHSAISVADTARSIAFYQGLGLTVGARSLNHGPEQDRLDGIEDARVAVTALMAPGAAGPHVELLCYGRGEGSMQTALEVADDDVAATRLVFSDDSAGAPPHRLRDLDGHRLEIEQDDGV